LQHIFAVRLRAIDTGMKIIQAIWLGELLPPYHSKNDLFFSCGRFLLRRVNEL